MTELKSEKCSVCRTDSLPVSESEVCELGPQIPQWQTLIRDGVPQLERVFKFRNFAEALAFTNKVGALAESEKHHPAIRTEWGKVTVTWWTHAIRGLHRNDFIMAARTDELGRSAGV